MTAEEELANLRAQHEVPARLGCSLVAHRDLGYCGWCAGLTAQDEANGWQLLALVERGPVRQPWEKTDGG